MRDYEAMYILKTELEEEAINAVVTRFEDVVKNGNGEIAKTDRWGKRRLAYEIDGRFDGYYVLMNFKSAKEVAQELERLLRINDEVIRHLLIKREE
jgi:small subunit ribosomal protein S6